MRRLEDKYLSEELAYFFFIRLLLGFEFGLVLNDHWFFLEKASSLKLLPVTLTLLGMHWALFDGITNAYLKLFCSELIFSEAFYLLLEFFDVASVFNNLFILGLEAGFPIFEFEDTGQFFGLHKVRLGCLMSERIFLRIASGFELGEQAWETVLLFYQGSNVRGHNFWYI